MITNALKTFDPSLYDKGTVIGEFSGRDSVAAILKALEADNVNYVLPVATFAGTEYGDYDSLYDNYIKLQERVKDLYGDSKTLYPLHEYNENKLWHLVNGRFVTELVNRFKFYNPCVACHLYFHITKIKYAKHFSRKIISGERESHDGRIKVNQLHDSLEAYKYIMKELGYDLMIPLQNEASGDMVESLIGWDWSEGKDHPKCVLSGNYRGIKGQAVYDILQLKVYIAQYLKPVGLLMGAYMEDKISIKELEDEIKDII